MGMQKAIASAVVGLVAIAAQFGMIVDPMWVTAVQTLLTTGLVWWVANKT